MTDAALRGKPDAGNPHVRFDEGEVAPAATPRRGSLLYTKNAMVSIASACVVALATTCLAADIEWLDAADGAWGAAANWKGGAVPDGARAVITNETAGFTVTVAETANPKISALLLGNAKGTATNVVRITGHLRSQATSNDDKNVAVQGGGLLHIDGGVLAITNSAAKNISLYGTSATKKGILKVSGGLLDFRATSAAMSSGINLGSDGKINGLFEATGGKVRLTAPYASNSSYWGLYCEYAPSTYDVMSIGGTAEIEIANRCIDLRIGRHVIKDSAKFVCKQSWGNIFSLKAKSSSGVTLTIQDSAEFDLSEFDKGLMGNYWWQGSSNRSTMNIAGGTVKLPRNFVVGDGNGSSVLNISGGSTTLGYYGFDIGAYVNNQLSSRAQNPAGTVNVTGGSLYVMTSQGNSDTFKKAVMGLIVGNGSQIGSYSSTAGYSCTGSLKVSGGAVTNGVGLFVVGAGRATGSVVQTGGTIYHGLGFTTDAWRKKTPMVIGFGGGTGTYIISNGFTHATAPIYVGGVETNVFERDLKISNWPAAAFTDRTAVGKLVVAGGRLSTATTDLVVGADGSGTLEIGPSATVSIGNPNGSGNVILSNRTASVTRFVLGADGAGRLATPNALIVADGAKLEVDATEYAGGEKWIKLVNCNRREGSFAAGDITVVGRHPEGGEYEIVQDRNGDSSGSIWLHRRSGSLIIVM